MAWTEFTPSRYERSGGRYASDVSDAEWALIAPLMPAPRKVGRPRTTDLRDVFADGGYAGPKLKGALEQIGRWTVQIVKRSDTAQGFEVIPRRWVVERTLAWLGRCRRMAKDWEETVASAEAWLLLAHIRRVTGRLARA